MIQCSVSGAGDAGAIAKGHHLLKPLSVPGVDLGPG